MVYNECIVYSVYVYIGVLSQIIIYIGILNINTSPYIKTITGSLVLELLTAHLHTYKLTMSDVLVTWTMVNLVNGIGSTWGGGRTLGNLVRLTHWVRAEG